jgi:hypothetical protein
LAVDPPSDHNDKDGQFLWRLATEGLQLERRKMLQGSPGMSLNTTTGFADTSISAYCPDGYLNNS